MYDVIIPVLICNTILFCMIKNILDKVGMLEYKLKKIERRFESLTFDEQIKRLSDKDEVLDQRIAVIDKELQSIDEEFKACKQEIWVIK